METATAPSKAAYLYHAMTPINTEVRKIKGTGAPMSRIALLEYRVSRMSGVWLAVRDRIEHALDEVFERRCQQLNDSLAALFSSLPHQPLDVLHDATSVKNEHDEEEPNNDLRA